MTTSYPEDAAYNVSYRAYAQASNEFTAAHPEFDLWQATPEERAVHDAYVGARIDEIIAIIKEQQ
ncbi:hypothetical protein [Kitasatospora sp. NPDC001175]|uniref:hypothetical protein n=1 Tax=Kitasatospora sp. NPDC001175 TaxID=3157103 RepID=UPI003D06E411